MEGLDVGAQNQVVFVGGGALRRLRETLTIAISQGRVDAVATTRIAREQRANAASGHEPSTL